MDIIAGVSAGISALKAATDLLRGLRDGLKSGEKGNEITERIVEIYNNIVDSKDALVDAKDEIQRLNDRIRELEKAIALKQSVKFEGGAYWQVGDQGSLDGPYCTRCWDFDGILHRAVKSTDWGGEDIVFICNKHQPEHRMSIRRALVPR